ncbi:hypothetical protein [Gordonia sp. C13]|uniref:hypothetical protein n=1 Tax=Gordonia sp. C13 TaxID=2935078 RepID=UPI00200B5BAF|nr:hypothetical protein [Gordonia sp. C13]MCK8615778.1 hypothetical protein [Gordonia sp. C13]
MSWAVEREQRLEHLGRLPGKLHHERFEALNRASRLFSTNGVELTNHIAKFVGTLQHANNLPDEFEHETVRLFHNYIASVATLRDIQRATHRKIWPDKPPKDERPKPDDPRTYWEMEVYSPKVVEMFGNDDIQFLFDLRNCTVHHSVPMVSIGTNWSWGQNQPFVHANNVALKRSELDKYTKWTSASKRFLKSQHGDVDFLPLLEEYSKRAREFFQWFWEQIQEAVRLEVEEYYRKRSEFDHWLSEEQAKPDFQQQYGGNPMPGTLRRNRARAHAERCAFGTTGWGGITVDSKGVAVVGESDWCPLPAVGKYRKDDQPASEWT